MSDCRLIVVSCPPRKPIQDIWWKCQQTAWPDCPFPITMLSPEHDVGWNENFLALAQTIDEEFILFMLDDHWLEPLRNGERLTSNMLNVLAFMKQCQDVAFVKVQAGNAWSPELPVPEWDRLGEYDREHHPFKRTNIVPTMFRRSWLVRFLQAVLNACEANEDRGRTGALAFEGKGTRLTMNRNEWPERMLGIDRPKPDENCNKSLLNCIASDGIREGRLQKSAELELTAAGFSLEELGAFR